jgi:hypothetical protein
MEEPAASDTASDRLTRICAAMTMAMEAHSEYREDDRCAIFMDCDADEDRRKGGLVLHGYDDDEEAVINLLLHLRAIVRARGGDLVIMGVRLNKDD